ncbi:MAG: hypothetical protein AAB441_00050 [Patescibacteria group bacterium]
MSLQLVNNLLYNERTMLNKILVFIFFLLIFIFLIEVGLIYFTTNSKQPTSQNITINPQPSQSFNPNITITQPVPTLSSYDFWSSKKGILTDSYKVDTSIGTISLLDTNGGLLKLNNQEYSYVFKFTLQKDDNKHEFIFDNEDLKVLKLFKKNKDNSTTSSQIKTLKNNEIIEIKETVNLLGTNVRPTEIIITVLNQ